MQEAAANLTKARQELKSIERKANEFRELNELETELENWKAVTENINESQIDVST